MDAALPPHAASVDRHDDGICRLCLTATGGTAPRRPAFIDLRCRDGTSRIGDFIMMNGIGMGFGMGFGWLFGLLILVLVILAIAALVKYLRK